jgi:hypothetical protein
MRFVEHFFFRQQTAVINANPGALRINDAGHKGGGQRGSDAGKLVEPHRKKLIRAIRDPNRKRRIVGTQVTNREKPDCRSLLRMERGDQTGGTQILTNA